MSARRRRKRARVEPTHEWERLVPLFEWPKPKEEATHRPLVTQRPRRGLLGS